MFYNVYTIVIQIDVYVTYKFKMIPTWEWAQMAFAHGIHDKNLLYKILRTLPRTLLPHFSQNNLHSFTDHKHMELTGGLWNTRKANSRAKSVCSEM